MNNPRCNRGDNVKENAHNCRAVECKIVIGGNFTHSTAPQLWHPTQFTPSDYIEGYSYSIAPRFCPLITHYLFPITHILKICHFVSYLIHQYANMMTSFYKMAFKMGKLSDLVWWHFI